MSDDKKILEFPSKSDVPPCPLEIEQSPSLYRCNHPKIRFVHHDRNLLCVDCGKTLDPFSYLLDGAQTIVYAWREYDHLKIKASELRETISKLEKERKRLAAQVKRLKEKEAKSPDKDTMDMRTR